MEEVTVTGHCHYSDMICGYSVKLDDILTTHWPHTDHDHSPVGHVWRSN